MSESDSRDSVGQSADDVLKTSKHHDLRTRIAAALRGMTGDLTYEAMADAVIRELGLRLDSTCHIHDREGKQRCIRYVTEWEVE